MSPKQSEKRPLPRRHNPLLAPDQTPEREFHKECCLLARNAHSMVRRHRIGEEAQTWTDKPSSQACTGWHVKCDEVGESRHVRLCAFEGTSSRESKRLRDLRAPTTSLAPGSLLSHGA